MFSREFLRNFQEHLFCGISATAAFAHSRLTSRERFNVQYSIFLVL